MRRQKDVRLVTFYELLIFLVSVSMISSLYLGPRPPAGAGAQALAAVARSLWSPSRQAHVPRLRVAPMLLPALWYCRLRLSRIRTRDHRLFSLSIVMIVANARARAVIFGRELRRSLLSPAFYRRHGKCPCRFCACHICLHTQAPLLLSALWYNRLRFSCTLDHLLSFYCRPHKEHRASFSATRSGARCSRFYFFVHTTVTVVVLYSRSSARHL